VSVLRLQSLDPSANVEKPLNRHTLSSAEHRADPDLSRDVMGHLQEGMLRGRMGPEEALIAETRCTFVAAGLSRNVERAASRTAA
jgi:hypothetical protein